jgi:hypothetical protein
MKALRLAALVAVPAALLLSSCAGGSSGIGGGGGGTPFTKSNVRFVNGTPTSAPNGFDVYYQSNGSASPSSPLIAALKYAIPSDYQALPTTAGNVIVQNAGGGAPSTGAPQATSCPVPQFANNQNYSIVITNANGALNCLIFQDALYAGPGNQYRFHDASANANTAIGTTVAYGTATAPALPGATFAVQGTTSLGTPVVGTTSPTFLLVNPTQLGTTTNVSFTVGQNTAAATEPSYDTLDASALLSPGTTTQPNAGNNNFTLPSGTAGASIYAIDCAAAALPTGSHCVGGVALIGVFDTH